MGNSYISWVCVFLSFYFFLFFFEVLRRDWKWEDLHFWIRPRQNTRAVIIFFLGFKETKSRLLINYYFIPIFFRLQVGSGGAGRCGPIYLGSCGRRVGRKREERSRGRNLRRIEIGEGVREGERVVCWEHLFFVTGRTHELIEPRTSLLHTKLINLIPTYSRK
ncbi:hypothetical protein F4809DRAFT_194736 [Biscogniauxia mediterranea]|nr:hypothetical protein F4809DRAFT_194736 [Biscogniauxia mediterranea]